MANRSRIAAAVAAIALAFVSIAAGSGASTIRPTVTKLYWSHGGSWGGDTITVTGTGFVHVAKVLFGTMRGKHITVKSATQLTVSTPEPDVAEKVHVRVVFASGAESAATSADIFTYTTPTWSTRMNTHWSTYQARTASTPFKSRVWTLNHVSMARSPGYWTPAMGRSAVHRAAGYLGLPYSLGGGTGTGPSYGVCSTHPYLIDEFECHIWGFDCSGMTMFAWHPYERLAHFAATQKYQAGKFHPALSELQPGDLMFLSEGGSAIGHVAMYAGHGKVIQASESGWPERYSTLHELFFWHPRYFGATRPMSTGVQGTAPDVTGMSVHRAPIAGGTVITIYGHHLDTTSQVHVGSTNTWNYTLVTSTRVQVTLPKHTAATVDVTVTNAWGTSGKVSADRLTYTSPPGVSALSTHTGPTAGGNTVTVTGSSFYGVTGVTVGGHTATNLHVVSPTQLTITVPAHAAGSTWLVVRTKYGTSRTGTASSYTYQAPPPPPSPSPTPSPTTSSDSSSSSAPPTTSAPPPTSSSAAPTRP